MAKTIILGAGMSGLAAARRLRTAGDDVELVDKGRGVGGRLATRRMAGARVDHGAQFFTTRGKAFKELTDEAIDAGVVREWCRGFGEPDGYPRYCGSDGMTALAKWMADGFDIRLGEPVHRIDTHDDVLRFVAASGQVLASGQRVIITAPIPQTLDLFERSAIAPPTDIDDALRSVDYFATLGLLAVVEGTTAVPAPGGMQFDDGPFTFIADNLQKGISSVRALTFHAEHDYSLRRYDDDPDEVHAELLDLAKPWLGDATVVESQLKKWRYAGPVTPLAEPTLSFDHDGHLIALAGDAFAGPKVEGAFNSGEAAAARLLGRA